MISKKIKEARIILNITRLLPSLCAAVRFLRTCVSGALVVLLETSRFIEDQFLQPILGKIIQFHGESEGLLSNRLKTDTTKCQNSCTRAASFPESCSVAAVLRPQRYRCVQHCK